MTVDSSPNTTNHESQSSFEKDFSVGKELFNKKNFIGAYQVFNTCMLSVEDRLSKLQLHNYLGQCCHIMAQICPVSGLKAQFKDLSKIHFTSGVEIGEMSEKGRLITAFCQSWLGKTEEATSLVDAVIEKNPQCIEAYVMLVKIYENVGDQARAKSVEQKLIEIQKEQAKQQLEDYRNRIRSALPNNVVIMSLEERFPDIFVNGNDTERVKKVLLNNGYLELSIGRYDVALEDFEELLKITPNNVKALVGAGYACNELKDIEKAKQYIEKALQLDQACKEALDLRNKLNAS